MLQGMRPELSGLEKDGSVSEIVEFGKKALE